MKKLILATPLLLLAVAQPAVAAQMGDTSLSRHEYTLLGRYQSGSDNGVDCYNAGMVQEIPDGMVVNATRAGGTITFDAYQDDSATVSPIAGVPVVDGNGNFFGYVEGEQVTYFQEIGETYMVYTSYTRKFKGVLNTAEEPQLKGSYSYVMDQDWNNGGDEGHLRCEYEVAYQATLTNGVVPEITSLYLLQDIHEVNKRLGLKVLSAEEAKNALRNTTLQVKVIGD